MPDPLLVGALAGLPLFGASLLVRTIAARFRTLAQRRRNHRWVRNQPARPACPDVAGRVGTPRTTVDTPGVTAPVVSAVPNTNRQRVQL